MARLVFSLNLSSSHGFNPNPRNYQSSFITQTVAPRFRTVRCQSNPESSETQEKLIVNDETSTSSKEVKSSQAGSAPSSSSSEFPLVKSSQALIDLNIYTRCRDLERERRISRILYGKPLFRLVITSLKWHRQWRLSLYISQRRDHLSRELLSKR